MTAHDTITAAVRAIVLPKLRDCTRGCRVRFTLDDGTELWHLCDYHDGWEDGYLAAIDPSYY